MTHNDINLDIPESPLDVSRCRTAEEVAHDTRDFLAKYAESASQVVLRSPEELQEMRNLERDDVWAVVWEAGPSEWAINLSGGVSMYHSEFGGTRPQIRGLDGNSNWGVECANSFTLHFY